jgi:hypothetical protein
MSEIEWKKHSKDELNHAEISRQEGNEGKARVCARRAAGHVAGEYLRRQGIQVESMNALNRLKVTVERNELTDGTKTTIEHFLIHTTPEFKLPIGVDLIEDVRFLARDLLNEDLD